MRSWDEPIGDGARFSFGIRSPFIATHIITLVSRHVLFLLQVLVGIWVSGRQHNDVSPTRRVCMLSAVDMFHVRAGIPRNTRASVAWAYVIT